MASPRIPSSSFSRAVGAGDPGEQFYSPDLDGLVRKDNLDDIPAIVTSLLRDAHRGH